MLARFFQAGQELDLHVGVFQADSFMAMVGVGLQVLEEVYPEMMKLRWA